MATRKVDRTLVWPIAEAGFTLKNTTENTSGETLKFYAVSQAQAAAGSGGTLIGTASGSDAGVDIPVLFNLSALTKGAWYELRAFSYSGATLVRGILPNPATASRILFYVAQTV